MKVKTFFVLFISILFFNVIQAQSTYKFLNLQTSPRAAALAGSFVANHDDPNVIFYNPAGIGLLKKKPVSFSYLKHLLDINSVSLVYSQEIGNLGRFAAGIDYINYGNFVKADEYGNKNGSFGAADLAVIVGYSNLLGKNFYYGTSVKFIYSGIADRSSTGYAFDLGLNYVIPSYQWSFGFSILNLGSQITSYYSVKERLPLDIRAGFAKTLKHVPLTIYFSLNRLNETHNKFSDYFKQFTFGAEFRLSKVLRARFGFDNQRRTELPIGSTPGLAGFSFGFGVVISKYKFDYAFSSLGSIGGLNRIGITTSL